MRKKNDQFIDGYLAAVQFIGVTMGEETLAEYTLNESGYSCNEFLSSQRKSGFETRQMNKIIRRALTSNANET